MSDSASTTDLEVPPIAITLERSLYYAFCITLMLYGVEFFMYFFSVYLFSTNTSVDKGSQRTYLAIGGSMFILITIALVSNIAFLGLMYIDHRNDPGGPLGYFIANTSSWWSVFGSAADVLCNFVGDAMLIYRCFVIWKSNWYVIALPIVMYLGSVVMAILFLYQSAVPGASFYSGLAVNFGVPWTVLTVALNAMVTILIIIPILRARNGMKNILPDDTVKIYTGVSAVLVESALPFTILGIIYAILYGTNNEVAPAFTFIWGTFCALSPQFIIFRVAMGKGWTREVATKQPTGSIRFGSWNPFSQGDQSKSGHSDHTAGASTAYEDDAPHVQDEKSSVSGSLPPV